MIDAPLHKCLPITVGTMSIGSLDECCWTCKHSHANRPDPFTNRRQLIVNEGGTTSCWHPTGNGYLVRVVNVCPMFKHRAED